MSEEETTPWTYTSKTPAEIEALAWDIIGGRVFGTWACPQDLIGMCFMIITFMKPSDLDQLKANKIAHLYEYLDKASPRGVNGYPSFFSAHYINEDDFRHVITRMKEITEFQKATGPK